MIAQHQADGEQDSHTVLRRVPRTASNRAAVSSGRRDQTRTRTVDTDLLLGAPTAAARPKCSCQKYDFNFKPNFNFTRNERRNEQIKRLLHN